MIQSQRTIWLLDQAGSYQPDMLQDLIDSYKAGASRTVVDKNKRGVPHRFSTYAPKAFAAHSIFDMDLADRCIPIVTLPAVRHVEPIMASDHRLDQVRRELYRYTLVHGRRVFAVPAYVNGPVLGGELGFEGRTWELFWPLEVTFDWLGVPEEHRVAARDFYRKSIISVKPELDPLRKAILLALVAASARASGNFKVRSDELASQVQPEVDPDTVVDATRLGRVLFELGIAVDKDRPRVGKRRVTEWTVDSKRLKNHAERWGLLEVNADVG